jgi:hypothetical protein
MKVFILCFLLLECFLACVPVSISGASSGYLSASYNAQQLASSGASFSVRYNTRAYLTKSCGGWSPNNFYQMQLLDKTLSVDVDLSTVSCGCNIAFYLVSMPGYTPSGGHQTDYYCDANNVGGTWCPEMDLMEANQKAFAVAPHKCDPKQGNAYTNCDRSGCSRKFHSMGGAYGYGAGYKINTQNPFTMSWTFKTSGGQLSSIVATLRQGANSVSITMDGGCGGGYLASMTSAFQTGMVPVFSFWGDSGSTMQWLDVPPCSISESCSASGIAKFSNLRLTGGSSYTPIPIPVPAPKWPTPAPRAPTPISYSSSYPCYDVLIPGETATCAEQKAWGNCYQSWMAGRCQKTCGTCPTSCTDIPVPGDPNSCAQQASWGNCNRDYMAGRCDRSCNRCPSGWREEGDAEDGSSAPIVGIAVGSAVAGVVGLIVVAVIIVVVYKKLALREETV